MTAEAASGGVPAGWYPDPTGAAQWRHWDGGSWGEATTPYGPPPPDAAWVLREQLTWGYLRAVAPLALVAPAASAIVFAAQTSSYGPVRRWIQRFSSAWLHGQPVPAMPAVKGSPIASATEFAVFLAVLVGLLAWARFARAAVQVAVLARYPQRHHPTWVGFVLVVPLLGPVVAGSATRASLPKGHEATRVLDVGWTSVLLGQLSFAAVVATVWSTSSLVAAWVVAACCAVAWAVAAVALPLGLSAIAEDHESLRVRAAARPS